MLQCPFPRGTGVWIDNAPFAHPAEREVARILDFFGLRWSYEPTSFVLSTGSDGEVTEMMTPDFYLPDLGVYVEVTTMRQSLVTRKNRKARLLRERYPDVKLKVLYRRDYLRLVDQFRGALDGPHKDLALDVFLSKEQIEHAVAEFATRVLARCERSRLTRERLPTLVIGSPGSRQLLHDCLHRLHACGIHPPSCEVEFAIAGKLGRMSVSRSSSRQVMGREVILLETLVSTGMHLAHVQRWLRRQGVFIVDTAALCARPGSAFLGCTLDYIGFEAPNQVLAGYGLQIRSEMASLREIVTVRTPASDPVVALLAADGI